MDELYSLLATETSYLDSERPIKTSLGKLPVDSAVRVHSTVVVSSSSTVMTKADLEATLYCCFDFFSRILGNGMIRPEHLGCRN